MENLTRRPEPWVDVLAFKERDIPHWLQERLTDEQKKAYVGTRQSQMGQMAREAQMGGGWVALAAGYLRTIGDNSPPFGGLHHSLLIISEALYAQLEGPAK